jgi:hypothetical protein
MTLIPAKTFKPMRHCIEINFESKKIIHFPSSPSMVFCIPRCFYTVKKNSLTATINFPQELLLTKLIFIIEYLNSFFNLSFFNRTKPVNLTARSWKLPPT